jgi:hypothetical protein
METKFYRADNKLMLDQIRKVTISPQMSNLNDIDIYGRPFLVKVESEENSSYNSIKKEFIVISNGVGNAILAFMDSNEKFYFIPPHIITKIEAIELDLIADITKRTGM